MFRFRVLDLGIVDDKHFGAICAHRQTTFPPLLLRLMACDTQAEQDALEEASSRRAWDADIGKYPSAIHLHSHD